MAASEFSRRGFLGTLIATVVACLPLPTTKALPSGTIPRKLGGTFMCSCTVYSYDEAGRLVSVQESTWPSSVDYSDVYEWDRAPQADHLIATTSYFYDGTGLRTVEAEQ